MKKLLFRFQSFAVQGFLLRKFNFVVRYSIFFLILSLISCMIVPSDKDGIITDLTYKNTTIGLDISAPNHDWTITKDVPDPSKVLIIKYLSTSFNPNVVVSASVNSGNDSITVLTMASIDQFCSDSTITKRTILYDSQTVENINGGSFGLVKAYVTKTYTDSLHLSKQIDLEINQYVTSHNGYVIAITFLDASDHFDLMGTEFGEIVSSIHLL